MISSNPIDKVYPVPYNDLTYFHKLIIMRIVRPEKTIPALKNLISENIGSKYIVSPPFDIVKAYSESKNTTPILFILSPGADPLSIIENLAKKVGKNWVDDVKSLSLGQGQGEAARINIENGIKYNKWIILQNCHLAKSFMNDLEKLIESIQFDETSTFRLFLTAMPSKVIPISIIQNSIKLTNEPPRGLKQSIARSYGSFDDRFYESCSKKAKLFKRFIYSFCFFHALILERRKYGPLGWNIPYEFSGSDLSISLSQLKMFLESYADIQWDALNYMVAEANYGGRVTDPADRRLISTIFKDICREDVLYEDYRFSNLEEYSIPNDGKYEEHNNFINQIPTSDSPAIFGLHENADITCAINETTNVFNYTLLTLPRIVSNKTNSSAEMIVKEKATDILNKLPKFFDIDEVRSIHPIKHDESLNSVLHQELMRYNNLLAVIKSSMKSLIDAINGDSVMTSDLEMILLKIYDNKIPANIEKVSYPSTKSFSSWINDLLEKLKFMQKWIDEGIPSTFWISGFFFTQSFLTGILQNFARKV